MEEKNTLTKVLAIAGTVLVWFPILAPILLSIILLVVERKFLFDYLMPAELFPVALLGSALLLWAALRARTQVQLVLWGFVVAVIMLLGGQWLAVVTGLASGDRPPTGWAWALVLASLSIYWLGLIMVGTGGALLLRDLRNKPLPE